MRYAKFFVLFLAVFCVALQAQETVKLGCGEAIKVPSHQDKYPVQAGGNSLLAIGLEHFLVGIAVDQNCQKIGLEGFTKYNKVAFYIPLTGKSQPAATLKAEYRAMYAPPVVISTPAPQAPATLDRKTTVARNTSSSAPVVISSTPAALVVKYVTDPTLQAQLNKAQSRVRELQQQLDTARKNPPVPAPAKGGPEEITALRKQVEVFSKGLKAEKERADNLNGQLKAAQDSARTLQQSWDKERQKLAARIDGLEKTLETQQKLASRQPGSRVGEQGKPGVSAREEKALKDMAGMKAQLDQAMKDLAELKGIREIADRALRENATLKEKYEPATTHFSGFSETMARMTRSIFWYDTVYTLQDPPQEYLVKLAEYRKGKVVQVKEQPKKTNLAAELLAKPKEKLTLDEQFLLEKKKKEEEPIKVYASFDRWTEQQCLAQFVTKDAHFQIPDVGNALGCLDLQGVLAKQPHGLSFTKSEELRVSTGTLTFVCLVLAGTVLAVAMFWSKISRRLTRLKRKSVEDYRDWVRFRKEVLSRRVEKVGVHPEPVEQGTQNLPKTEERRLSACARGRAERGDVVSISIQAQPQAMNKIHYVPDCDVDHSEAV